MEIAQLKRDVFYVYKHSDRYWYKLRLKCIEFASNDEGFDKWIVELYRDDKKIDENEIQIQHEITPKLHECLKVFAHHFTSLFIGFAQHGVEVEFKDFDAFMQY